MTVTVSSRSQAGFWIVFAVSLLLGFRVLFATLALSLRDDEYTYILLIFPVSAALLFLEWPSLQALRARNERAGATLLLLAAVTAGFALACSRGVFPDVRQSMAMFALVLWWVGDFVLFFGWRAYRLALFPLYFLFGLVPPPRFALNAAIEVLQLGSAWTAHALFWSSRVPVDQSGVFLTIPGLTIQVAQECSSIRSSSMLLATTIVIAQILLRSPWRRVLLICLAAPLSIAKNGLRIYTIAMLGTRVDPGYLTGRFHRQGGIVFFAIALIAVLGLLWMLRRAEESPPELGSPG